MKRKQFFELLILAVVFAMIYSTVGCSQATGNQALPPVVEFTGNPVLDEIRALRKEIKSVQDFQAGERYEKIQYDQCHEKCREILESAGFRRWYNDEELESLPNRELFDRLKEEASVCHDDCNKKAPPGGC